MRHCRRCIARHRGFTRTNSLGIIFTFICTLMALTYTSYMPKLRKNLSTSSMNGLYDLPPTCKRQFTIEVRHIGITMTCWMINHGTLGNNQAYPTLGSSSVIIDNIFSRNMLLRLTSSHWSHNYTIF